MPSNLARLLISVVFLGACARVPTYAPPEARVHHGPAYEHWLGPIAALPVECALHDPCPPDFLRAVETLGRMSLEFQGHSIIDSELLNAESRQRFSISVQNESTGTQAVDEQVIEDTRTGKDFVDLAPEEQRALLDSVGALSVLRATVNMGSKGPSSFRPRFEPIAVEFTLHRLSDHALVWRTRCTVHTGNTNLRETALEIAARCALDAEAQF